MGLIGQGDQMAAMGGKEQGVRSSLPEHLIE